MTAAGVPREAVRWDGTRDGTATVPRFSATGPVPYTEPGTRATGAQRERPLPPLSRLPFPRHPRRSIYKAYDAYEKGKYRTAWGYQGGLEFYPMADDNLHIFLTAIGKKYNLSERAKALDASLDDTARLSIGFIYRLPLY